MTCACGTLICYLCRKQIDEGYRHFCQTALCDHKQCKQCALFTNSEQDDERAMREAGIRAAEDVRGESLQGNKACEGEVTIDVDGILKVPGKATTTISTHKNLTGPPRQLRANPYPRLPPIREMPPIPLAPLGLENPIGAPDFWWMANM
jgi:hypothetical protein